MNFKRILFYCIGIPTLTLGLILNTKCALGTSPIVSIAYAGADITGKTIGDITLIEYCVFIAIQMLVHLRLKKPKSVFLMDALQLPFSLLFSRMMNLFAGMLPSFAESSMPVRLAILMVALAFTALGACLMLNMKLIPNPGDGMVNVISEVFGFEMGLSKNIFDVVCVSVTISLCLLSGNAIRGLGIGSVIAIVLTGRLMSVYNKLFRKQLLKAAGLA